MGVFPRMCSNWRGSGVVDYDVLSPLSKKLAFTKHRAKLMQFIFSP